MEIKILEKIYVQILNHYLIFKRDISEYIGSPARSQIIIRVIIKCNHHHKGNTYVTLFTANFISIITIEPLNSSSR